MKAKIQALTIACGCLVSVASVVSADNTRPMFGPLVATQTRQYVDLNGATVPAGTYRTYSLQFNFTGSIEGEYSSEAWPGIWGDNTGTVLHAFPFSGKNSYLDENPRLLSWDAAFSTPYQGGQPLFFSAEQDFFTGFVPAATWSNISLTLKNAAAVAPASFTDLGTLSFPAIGSGPSTTTTTLSLAPGEIRWAKFVVTGSGVTAANGKFVDIDTHFSQVFGTNDTLSDTLLFVYDSDGLIYAGDDDDGEGLSAQLSFGGSTQPRPAETGATSVSLPFDGRNGALPAGTYWVAFCAEGVFSSVPREAITVAHDGWAVTSGSSRQGTINLKVSSGSVNPSPVCVATDTEPNDARLTPQTVSFTEGFEAVCGTTTGNVAGSGATSPDFYRIQTAQSAPGTITRHRVRLVGDSTHGLTMRGTNSVGGVLDPNSDANLVAAVASTNPPRMLQWYTLGTEANPFIDVRVTGTGSSPNQYQVIYDGPSAVTIDELSGGPLNAGSITITWQGVTTVDTDMCVLDSNLNPIPNFSNDDTAGAPVIRQANLTRTFAAGTYYIAVSNFDLMTNQSASTDEGSPNRGFGMASAGVIANGSTNPLPTGTAQDLSFLVVDSAGNRFVPLSKTSSFEVKFVKFTVAGGATAGCNPADIACDTGDPLVSNPGCTNSPTGPNEGDYNAFFAADGFFFQAGQGLAGVGGYCDIACDNGDALSTNPGCTNNGVNEGDYNCFFNNLFLPCV